MGELFKVVEPFIQASSDLIVLILGPKFFPQRRWVKHMKSNIL